MAQHERFAVQHGEFVDGVSHLSGQLILDDDARGLGLGAAADGVELLVVGGAGVTRPRLELVLAQVEGDLVEPAGELRLLLELGEGLVGPDEGLLGHVFGVVAVAHHGIAQIDDPGAVLVDQSAI